MHENKSSNIKTGFILVYTLLMGMLCILLALLCFEMLLDIRKNQSYLKGCVVKVQENQQGREYVLTEFKNYIMSSVSSLTISNITAFLNSLASFKWIQWQNCYVTKCDLSRNYIYAVFPCDASHFIRETYQYKIVNGILKFKFVSSTVIEGSL